jgi:hypothetical protein
MCYDRFSLPAIAALAACTLAACAQNAAPPGMPASPAAISQARHGWLSPAAKAKALVYVSDNTANAVDVYPQGVTNPSPVGRITDGISSPLGNFVDRNGTLYVANAGNSTVTEYPKGSTTPSVTLSTDISRPISVAVDGKGDVAVGEFSSNTILEFPAGSSSPSVTIVLLTLPEALAFDRSGRLYAAWNVNNGSGLTGNVSRCEYMRAYCTDLGISEGESGGLALDADANLILGDQTNGVVNIYPPHTTSPSRTIAMSGHDPYKFELNKPEQELYVADIDTGIVLIYDYATGSQVGTISQGLQSAWGVSLSPAAKDAP